MEHIFVLNCGSSSIKFAVIEPISGQRIVDDMVEKLSPGNYREALDNIIQQIQNTPDVNLSAIGHRVVHGGEAFTQATKIDQNVLNTIEACIKLAPLHNPNNIEGIKATLEAYPNLPQVAIFDTAFHQSMPKHSYLYPVPYDWYQEHKVRRYGFHGTSHHYVATQAAMKLNKPLSECSLLTAHLGNGCSATAIKKGKSVDTTMGLTPLEGLMMGTRSGDIDPGLHDYITHELGCDLAELTNLLNKESGLLGVSGVSNDMRDIHKAISENNERAKLALELFCFRLAKQLSALAISLDTLDALVFTGGIGENDTIVRAKTCSLLNLLNLQCDETKNATHGKKSDGLISTNSSTPIYVVKTDEELMIARECVVLKNKNTDS